MGWQTIDYNYPVAYIFHKELLWLSANTGVCFAFKLEGTDDWSYFAGDANHQLLPGQYLTEYATEAEAQTNYFQTAIDANGKMLAVLPRNLQAKYARLYIATGSGVWIREWRPSVYLSAHEIITGTLDITDQLSDAPLIKVTADLHDRIKIGKVGNYYGVFGYDGSDSLLFELSNYQNKIGGWTLGASSLTGTGITMSSYGDAYLAIGTTPPTAPNDGTGIFLNKTGLFGLSAGTQNFKIDATNGNITAIAGTIGGWTLSATTIETTGFKLDKTVPALMMGLATAFMTGAGVWMGKEGLEYKTHIGNPATKYLKWDGTDLTITGAIIAASSDIGGTISNSFTINNDLTDSDIDLILARTTGGNATLRWNGTQLSVDKITSFTANIKTDHIDEVTSTHGVVIDGITLKDGGALVITGGTNTFNLTNGTAIIDVAAGCTVNIDKSLTVDGQATTITGVTQANTITLNEGFTIGDGYTGTLTFSAASKTLTVELDSAVNQDLTTDASPTHATVKLSGLTDGYFPYHVADATGLANSVIYQASSRVGIGNTSVESLLTVGGDVYLKASTANLYMKDQSTGWLVSATTVIYPQANNSIRATTYTSGLQGWNINAIGDAEFNNITARGEVHTAVFSYNEIHATAGTWGVFKSAAKLRNDVTTVTSPTTFNVDVDDPDTGHTQVFAVGDILRIKDGSGFDNWMTVGSVSDQTTFWRYVCTKNNGTNTTFRAGAAVVDYGPSGGGFITLSADGGVGSSPNITMGTHAGSPWTTYTSLMRIGNLNGVYGFGGDTYGIGMGSYGVAGQPSIIIDTTNGIRIISNTTQIGQWDTSGNILIGQTGANQNNVYITSGALQMRTNTTVNAELTTAGVLTLGNTTNEHVSISSTAVQIKDGATVYTDLTAGTLTLGATDDKVVIDSTGMTVTSGGTTRLTALDSGVIAYGDNATTYISITASGMTVVDNNVTLATYAATTTFYDTGGADRLVLGVSGVTVGDATEGEYVTISSSGIAMYGQATQKVNIANDGTGWLGKASGGISWDASGNITVEGAITANTGYIGGSGGWTIVAGKFYGGSGSDFCGMIQGTTTTKSFFAGATDNSGTGADFYVTAAGALYATSATIVGDYKTSATVGLGGTKGIHISVASNEMYFYGDNGSGSIEKLISLGVITGGASEIIVGIGSSTSSNIAIYAVGKNAYVSQFGGFGSGTGSGVTTIASSAYSKDGNLNQVVAGDFRAIRAFPATDTGTLSALVGLYVRIGSYDDPGCTPGLTTTAYGVYVWPQKYIGTITTFYGLYFASPAGAGGTFTNYYAIYQVDAAAKNFLAGYTLAKGGIRVGTTDTDPGDNNLYVEGTGIFVGQLDFGTAHGTTLLIDHIGEHTGSHGVVIDNNLHVEGSITADSYVGISSGLTSNTVSSTPTALTAAQCVAYVHYVTNAAATTITLPAVSGVDNTAYFMCYMTTAYVLTIDPDAGDRIRLNGVALDDGDKIISSGVAGDYVTLHKDGANGWTVIGRSGYWSDGGA